ncbi:hypothetical protein B0H17DRAFT_975305 [Mycena rosella]|uniref:Zinc-finger domain-containing protein n=1 Tax=Mycena rosella TaxID=1033263 RepID=A0AAD7E1U3_MYCRO|nr:hypothetical protein B0H17DRAFT_975305 [Mycena rosella]
MSHHTLVSLQKNIVFVDVPPSPYATNRVRVASRDSTSTFKENKPWRVSTMQAAAAPAAAPAPSSLKRKLSYSELPIQAPVAILKKPKLTSGAATPVGSDVATNSYIYCHQCGRKRDKDDAAHCTYTDVQPGPSDRLTKTRRCHNKYCKSCLKNRYSEDIDVIKTNQPRNPTSEYDGVTYDYKCPKCRDVCNCSRCRKAKGLDPTGKFANTTRTPAESSATIAEGTVKPDEAKAKRAPRPKPKQNGPLPTLKWTKLHTNLSVQDAEARFHIREFVLRFFSKALPKAHLEELEHISGNGRSRYEEDEIVPWISEACLKSVILAFLSVLVEEETNETIKKAIQMGTKEMRSAGLGLSKIWQILSSLRDSLDASEPDSSNGNDSDDSETVPSFPDPLPLPDSAASSSRRTRSARNVDALIVDTVQMIPVVLGLIDAVLETNTIRAEIDKGAAESKNLAREVKASIRNANDRYDKSKKETENIKEQEFKARRDAHKQILQDIESAGKVAINRFNPRFSPLGADREGRMYYALSPSLAESDSAMEFIASMAAETEDASASKTKRKRRPKREENSLKEWSWFIAVRGKKPPPELGTLPFKPVATPDGADDGDDSDDDEIVDKWWAIGSGPEIRRLITWITLKYRLNEGTISASSSTASTPLSGSASPPAGWDERGMEMSPHPSKLELLALVANLEDYAMGLEFRVRDGDTASAGVVEADKGKGKST